jgi:predicted nuclease of predicted toxin-antitoxin system
MRFLVDRCAGRRLAEWLRTEGYDVVESRALGPDPGDTALLSMAVQDARKLVTIDSDFGLLIFAGGATHCGMVRLPDVPAAERIALMKQVLDRHSVDLENGAIITVKGNRIRVTHPKAP